MTKLKITTDTIFKQTPVQSIELPDSEKVTVEAGTEFNVLSYLIAGNHVKVTLDRTLNARNTWTAYQGHIELLKDDGRKLIGKYVEGDRLPESVNLPLPYFSQLDNRYRPHGTCNVTSVAMVAYFYGIRPKNPDRQLEDEFFKEVEKRGWDRHLHEHLRRLFGVYGIYDDFELKASWSRIKLHLANGNPVIVSGDFTGSGHIMPVRGYEPKGWRVNDPYGEYFSSGYDTERSGENLLYSYELFERVNRGTGTIWAHFPEKR
jgi:hypothetical protein